MASFYSVCTVSCRALPLEFIAAYNPRLQGPSLQYGVNFRLGLVDRGSVGDIVLLGEYCGDKTFNRCIVGVGVESHNLRRLFQKQLCTKKSKFKKIGIRNCTSWI